MPTISLKIRSKLGRYKKLVLTHDMWMLCLITVFHEEWDACSVTRWLNYFNIFGHLQLWKLAQWHYIFAKEGSKFCQILDFKHFAKAAKYILPLFAKNIDTEQIALPFNVNKMYWTHLALYNLNNLVSFSVTRKKLPKIDGF